MGCNGYRTRLQNSAKDASGATIMLLDDLKTGVVAWGERSPSRPGREGVDY